MSALSNVNRSRATSSRGVRVSRRKGLGDHRLDPGEVEALVDLVDRIRTGRQARIGQIPDSLRGVPGFRDLVLREDPVGGLRFRHHVRDRVAEDHRKLTALVHELDRHALRLLRPPSPEELQNDVLPETHGCRWPRKTTRRDRAGVK
jgi:hypothetical protein